MRSLFAIILPCLLLLCGCKKEKVATTTPWGTEIDGETGNIANDDKGAFSLSDIISNGHMIMLTLSGPDTYYDYHGKGMGTQYMLLEKFAQKIGVELRVELCQDSIELIRKLQQGEGDIIGYPICEKEDKEEALAFCGMEDRARHTRWAVSKNNQELADSINSWYQPELIAKVKEEENFRISSQGITRHVYAPIMNKAGGVVSSYDDLFRRHAATARVDWRLLAALAYQESCFDSRAKSWAGASGLMQIMPSTAAHLGLSMSQIFEPEANVAAASRYIAELQGIWRDIPDPNERIKFVLASYNGGHFHIRDAMALCRKNGGNDHLWSNVAGYVLRLQQPAFYRDPVVKHGYMRGSETYNYVSSIMNRYASYCGLPATAVLAPARDGATGVSSTIYTPHRSSKPNRFKK